MSTNGYFRADKYSPIKFVEFAFSWLNWYNQEILGIIARVEFVLIPNYVYEIPNGENKSEGKIYKVDKIITLGWVFFVWPVYRVI